MLSCTSVQSHVTCMQHRSLTASPLPRYVRDETLLTAWKNDKIYGQAQRDSSADALRPRSLAALIMDSGVLMRDIFGAKMHDSVLNRASEVGPGGLPSPPLLFFSFFPLFLLWCSFSLPSHSLD